MDDKPCFGEMGKTAASYLVRHGAEASLSGMTIARFMDIWESAWTAGYRSGSQGGRVLDASGEEDEAGPPPRHTAEEVRQAIEDAVRDNRESVTADRHPTSVFLGLADQIELRRLSERTGYSRSELMRILLRIGLRLESDSLAPKDHRAALRPGPAPESP